MKNVNNDEAYQNLANAIVVLAAEDYRATLKGLARNPESAEYQRDAQELEKFFHSGWYEILTNVDGDYLLRKLREEQRGG